MEGKSLLWHLMTYRRLQRFAPTNDNDRAQSDAYNTEDNIGTSKAGMLLPPLLTYQSYLEQTSTTKGISSFLPFAFRTESTSMGDLTTPTSILMLTLLVTIIRKLKRKSSPLFVQLGRKLGKHTHGTQWVKLNEERIVKFGEYVFRFLYHSFAAVMGLYFFQDAIWWKDTKNLWIGYPNHPISTSMTWYYLVQCAYNVDACISLFELSVCVRFQNPFYIHSHRRYLFRTPICFSWNSLRRGDFWEMFLHHVITNCLVFGSSFFRFTRIGSMVFLVHDISDIPVDLSKLANFVKWKTTTSVCFTFMTIIWGITRLYILPCIILRSVLYESELAKQEGNHPFLFLYILPTFIAFLLGILFLNIFWFHLFIKMGLLLVFKGETHDLSAHKSGEQQETSKINVVAAASTSSTSNTVSLVHLTRSEFLQRIKFV